MSKWSWILALCAALLEPEWLGAATLPEAQTSHEEFVVAKIIGRLPMRESLQLKRALPIAAERLREHPACRGLFEALGADGYGQLAATIYTTAMWPGESALCQRRRAHAMTTVGGRRTILCSPAFGRLPADKAAIVLLHEALHHAGLSESPLDPGAPNQRQINHMVRVACGL